MKRTYHRSRRIRQWISEFLATCENETATFTEIQVHLNENYNRHAPTSAQLTNYLSKDVEFEKIEAPYHQRPLLGGGLIEHQNRWRVNSYRLTGKKRELTATSKSSNIDWEQEGVRTFGGN